MKKQVHRYGSKKKVYVAALGVLNILCLHGAPVVDPQNRQQPQSQRPSSGAYGFGDQEIPARPGSVGNVGVSGQIYSGGIRLTGQNRLATQVANPRSIGARIASAVTSWVKRGEKKQYIKKTEQSKIIKREPSAVVSDYQKAVDDFNNFNSLIPRGNILDNKKKAIVLYDQFGKAINDLEATIKELQTDSSSTGQKKLMEAKIVQQNYINKYIILSRFIDGTGGNALGLPTELPVRFASFDGYANKADMNADAAVITSLITSETSMPRMMQDLIAHYNSKINNSKHNNKAMSREDINRAKEIVKQLPEFLATQALNVLKGRASNDQLPAFKNDVLKLNPYVAYDQSINDVVSQYLNNKLEKFAELKLATLTYMQNNRASFKFTDAAQKALSDAYAKTQ